MILLPLIARIWLRWVAVNPAMTTPAVSVPPMAKPGKGVIPMVPSAQARAPPAAIAEIMGKRRSSDNCIDGDRPHTKAELRSPKGSRPMNASEIAVALSARVEDVCCRYLPRGRKEDRYWTAGDTSGAKGCSLFVRPGEPGIPAKWTTPRSTSMAIWSISSVCTPAEDRCGTPWRRPSRSAPANSGDHAGGYDREEATRRLWRSCQPIDGTHSEAYLHARAIGHCRFPALRFHPDLIHRGYKSINRLPALVAAVTGDDGAIEGVQRTWLDPKRPAKADFVRPRKALRRLYGRAVRFGGSASGATLLAGEGIETMLSLVTAVPGILAAATLSAGIRGAFEPPQDLALLVIARDKDMEDEHAANRLQHRCAERGIPSIVIVPDRSDLNDDLIAFGQETPVARIAPFIASTRSAATVDERCRSGRIITPS